MSSGEHRSSHHLGCIHAMTLSRKSCCCCWQGAVLLSLLSPGSQWASSACWSSRVWARILSDQRVEPSGCAFAASDTGAEAACWRLDKMKGSLKFCSLYRHKGSALSNMCKPSSRERLENSGRVSCWPSDSYWGSVYCQAFGFERRFFGAGANHPISQNRWLGCVWGRPWGIAEECETAGFIFCWDCLKIYSCTV